MNEQNENQAIEEMYKDIYEAINHNSVIDLIHGGFIGINTDGLTRELYDDGYRKQSVGEWLEIDDGVLIGDGKHLECSRCGVWKKDRQRSNFCPNCGAKMKGGAE